MSPNRGKEMVDEDSISTKIQETLYQQMQDNSEVCDVSLIIGKSVLTPHLNKLKMTIKKMGQRFSSLDLSDCTVSLGKIVLQHGDPSAMKASVEFLYSGTVHISEDNVAELLDCAEFFQIDELKKLCWRCLDLYIDLTTDNCLKLCLLSSKYDLDYYNKAYNYFSGHLTELLEKDEMLQLTPDSVMCLISDSTLNYVSRKLFFEFLIKWVVHDVNHREQFFLELFFEIDLLRLEREYIASHVLTEELIKKSCECISVVEAKLRCKDNLSHNEIGENDLILVAGGKAEKRFYSGFKLSHEYTKVEFDAIYAYSPWSDQWEIYIRLPVRLHEPCLALLSDSDLYIVEGGGITGLSLNVYKLNVRSKKWTQLKVSLPSGNEYEDHHIHGIVGCNNSIFLVASSSEYLGKVSSSEDEHTDPRSNHMVSYLLLKMNESELSCEIDCTVFECMYKGECKIQFCSFGKCFICVMCTEMDSTVGEAPIAMLIYDESSGILLNRSEGGCSGQILCNFKDKFVIPIIGDTAARHKVFFIDNKHWRHDVSTIIPPMPYYAERTEFPCIVYSDGLYAIGGKVTDREGLPKYLQSVLRFDFRTSEWNRIRDLPSEIVRGVCLLKRPMEPDACHSDCPHCLFDVGGAQIRQSLFSNVDSRLLNASIFPTYFDEDDDYYDGDDHYDEDDYPYGYSYDS